MGETLTNSEMFYAELLGHSEDLLDRHYHHLTRIIRPHLFYGWLRAKGAFTQSDQEEVENKYVTNCMKAGCLIDIIKTKGRSGFTAFLEVVEYEYGDLFLEITEKQPRMPPRDFVPAALLRKDSTKFQYSNRRRTSSADVLAMIGELTYSLTKQVASKTEELRRLHGLVDSMQTEQEQEAEENSRIYADLQAARETIEELKREKVEQLKRYRQMKDDREKLQDESSELRKQKDDFMSQCHQLREKIVNLGHSPSIRRQEPAEDVKDESKFYRKVEFISLKEKPISKFVVEPASDSDQLVLHAKDEIKKLKASLEEYKAKEKQWITENLELEEKLSNLECYQENSEHWQLSIDQIKQERDKALKEREELTKKYSDTTAKNEQLSEECRRYVEEFKRMEEMIKNLKHEIDERNRQVKATETTKPTVPVKPTFRSNQLQNRAKLIQNRGDDFEVRQVEMRHHPSHAKTGCQDAGQHAQLMRAPPMPPFADVKEKRKASYMNAFPLVVFAPESIQQRLFDFLQQYFDSCRGDVADASCSTQMSADDATEHEIIYEKCANGSTYSVTIEQLKKSLLKSKSAVLIPTIRAASIASMQQCNIAPLIVIVKFKNEYDYTELSAIEESLDHGKGHYETVVVSQSLADDFQRFSQHILHEVSHLVDKYSFLIGLRCSEYGTSK